MTLLTIIVVVAVFGVLVFIHELGHFLAAKRRGVRVDEFGLGFPPRLFSFKRGETLYSINLIPLGGFVRLYGEEGEGRRDPRSFIAQPARTRALILVMGVVMNLLLAYIVTVGLFLAQAPLFIGQASDYPGAKITSQTVYIIQVQPDSPAKAAGLREGDTIRAIGHQPVGSDQVMKRLLQEQAGKTVTLTVRQGGRDRDVQAHLRADSSSGALGVGLRQVQNVSLPLWSIPVVAAIEDVRLIWRTVHDIVGIFALLIVRQEAPSGVVGPIGITAIIGRIIHFGIVPLAQLVVGLSVSLAVFNALPIPALDGGRLAFIGLEKLAGRRIKVRVENAAHAIGIWLLLLLIVGISLYDVYRLTHRGL